jgi:hypothetical protein
MCSKVDELINMLINMNSGKRRKGRKRIVKNSAELEDRNQLPQQTFPLDSVCRRSLPTTPLLISTSKTSTSLVTPPAAITTNDETFTTHQLSDLSNKIESSPNSITSPIAYRNVFFFNLSSPISIHFSFCCATTRIASRNVLNFAG